jgi:hypothetical protein
MVSAMRARFTVAAAAVSGDVNASTAAPGHGAAMVRLVVCIWPDLLQITTERYESDGPRHLRGGR